MKNIRETFTSKKALITAVAVIGIVLIVFSCTFTGKINAEQDDIAQSEMENYGKTLEDKLSSSLCRLMGERAVEVMITFSSTFEDVYGYNELKTSENTLFSSTLSNETEPVVIKRNCPKIAGVMIVCLKKMEKEEYVAIKKAASTALNISQSKIYIIGGA